MFSQSPYDFSSKPKAVGIRRKKYRDPDVDNQVPISSNIMTDKRVMRGNTYALKSKLASQTAPLPGGGLGHAFGRANEPTPTYNNIQLAQTAPSQAEFGGAEERQPQRLGRAANVPETDSPTFGGRGSDSIFEIKAQLNKKHEPLDLTPYLVEKEKPPVPMKTVDTQTAEFEPRPPTPPYTPAKTGIDQATQIDPEDGLFDFDMEVQPLLSVLVSKTLEQALQEVSQEAELAALSNQMEEFIKQEEEEQRRVKNMEAKQAIEWEKKEKRKKMEQKRYAQQRRTKQKIMAVEFMREMLPGIRDSMCKDLASHPAWEKPEQKAVRTVFLPWLYQEVETKLEEWHNTRSTLDDLISSSLQQQLRLQHGRDAAIEEKRRKEAEERRRREMIIRIFIEGASIGLPEEETVGPIELNKENTISEIEADIQAYFAEKGIEVAIPEGGFISIAYNGELLDRDISILDHNIPMDGQLQIIINAKPEEPEETDTPDDQEEGAKDPSDEVEDADAEDENDA